VGGPVSVATEALIACKGWSLGEEARGQCRALTGPFFSHTCRTHLKIKRTGTNPSINCEDDLLKESTVTVIGREAERTSQKATQPPVDQSALWRLQHHSYAALHRISCEFHDGVLVLRGRLASYYLKQIAQSLVTRVDGVEHVDNRIEVVRPSPT
jgi:BON domain-containing protein